ncbi:hypothetical protein BS78_08G124500 [Paspalum vaginatum]|nr:hypothetical protein BS78_08G124500 [Paspalum vaginatum]
MSQLAEARWQATHFVAFLQIQNFKSTYSRWIKEVMH